MGYRTSSREAMTGTQGVTLETDGSRGHGGKLLTACSACCLRAPRTTSTYGGLDSSTSINQENAPPPITTSQCNGSSSLVEVPSSQGTVAVAS